MNREQLAHVVRAAATITGDGDIVIIGSQAILGAADVGGLPEEATMSMEADIAFRDDTDASKADAVDGAIGELSQFHETYGYYAQGVEIRTAVLPAGWEARADILDRPDSRPGFARCLEPHHLVVSATSSRPASLSVVLDAEARRAWSYESAHEAVERTGPLSGRSSLGARAGS